MERRISAAGKPRRPPAGYRCPGRPGADLHLEGTYRSGRSPRRPASGRQDATPPPAAVGGCRRPSSLLFRALATELLPALPRRAADPPRLAQPFVDPDWDDRGSYAGVVRGTVGEEHIVALASYVRLRDPLDRRGCVRGRRRPSGVRRRDALAGAARPARARGRDRAVRRGGHARQLGDGARLRGRRIRRRARARRRRSRSALRDRPDREVPGERGRARPRGGRPFAAARSSRPSRLPWSAHRPGADRSEASSSGTSCARISRASRTP